MVGGTAIENNKIVRKQKPILKVGYCKPCFSRRNKICCKQVVPATTYKSNVTLKSYLIFHQLNCESKYIIYLLESLKCQPQHVGKSETKFNVRLNNHSKYVTRKDAIPAF